MDVSDIAPQGLIDKRNSGAGALDYALDVPALIKDGKDLPIQEVAQELRSNVNLQKRLIKRAIEGTRYEAAILEYFPGDGLSSSYRTPEAFP